MNGEYDGSIRFDTRIDDKDLKSALDNLKRSLENATKYFDSLEGAAKDSFNSLKAQFDQIDQKAAVFGDTVGAITQKKKLLKAQIDQLISSGLKPEDEQVQALKTVFDSLNSAQAAYVSQSKQVGTSAEAAAAKVESVQDRLKSSMATLRDVMMGPVAAVQQIIAIFSQVGQKLDSVEAEWASQDQAVAVLNSTLKSTGAEAWTSSEKIQAMASRLQGLTGYADEAIISAQTVILTFDKVKGDNFDRATLAALNMSKVLGMDMVSASKLLGRAMNGNVEDVNALSRSGLKLSQQQEDFVKKLIESGRVEEAQNILLAEMEKRFGGAAAAAYETGSAVKDKLKVAFSEMNEELGRFLTDGLAPFRRDMIQSVNAIGDFFKKINDSGSAAETLRGIATALEAATAGVAAFILVSKGAVIVEALTKALVALNAAIIANPWTLVAAGTAALIVALVGAKKAEEEHEEAIRKKIARAAEEQKEVKSLADEYQNLYNKVNPTATEQNRMAEIAKTLHDRFPDLTTDTINLAAANGTLATKATEAADAQTRLNASQLVDRDSIKLVGLAKQANSYQAQIDILKAEDKRAGNKKPDPDIANFQKKLDEVKAEEKLLLASIAENSKIAQGYVFDTAPKTTAPAGGSSTGSTYTDAEKAAKANYAKVETLLNSITFFGKRNALHPYSEEEKKAFWESARDQLFDLDAIDLGPQALELKAKVKAAIDEAFKVQEPTYKPEGAGTRGQSGLPPPGFSNEPRSDFYDQLLAQLVEEFKGKPAQYGQSGLTPEGIALAPSLSDQIEALNAVAAPPTTEEVAADAAAYADMVVEELGTPSEQGAAFAKSVRDGMTDWALAKLQGEFTKPQQRLAPEGFGPRDDFYAQLVSDVVLPASLEAAQDGAMAYGREYRAAVEKYQKDKALAGAIGQIWSDALDEMEGEYRKRTPTFGQSGVTPGVVGAGGASPAEQIAQMEREASFFGPVLEGIKGSWDKFSDKLKEDVNDWSSVFESARSALADSFASAFETLGESIVTGTADWTSWGNSALKALAGVLRAVGYQLLAQAAYNVVLGITHLLMGDFAGAAAAAASALVAGAAASAAFVGAGIVEGLADGVVEANKFTDALDEQNDLLKKNRELWTKTSNAANAYTAVLTKVKEAASSFYASLQNVGTDIADILIDGIINGLSDEDFVYSMQEYITKAVVKAAVFTETFMSQVAAIGQEIANGVANGFSEDQLQSLRDRLAALYRGAAASAEVATSLVESVFASYDVGTLNVSGDQIAKLHNSEMVLNPGIAEEARRAGIYIGPTDNLGIMGSASMIPAKSQISITSVGNIVLDGQAVGRAAWVHGDQFQRTAYGA